MIKSVQSPPPAIEVPEVVGLIHELVEGRMVGEEEDVAMTENATPRHAR